MTHEFWNGVALASVFWVFVYAVFVIVLAFRAVSKGEEMGNTEAANDRGYGGNYIGEPMQFGQVNNAQMGDWTGQEATPRELLEDVNGRLA